MGRLRLILGPPGSGKTRLLLSEIAAEVRAAPLGPPAAPPLVLLVPEQQAAQAERAVLETLPQQVNSRVQVLSFRWLARRLELAAGETRGQLSPSGRSLLVWRLLGDLDAAQFADPAVRRATAGVMARLLDELAEGGTNPDDLRARAEALAAEHPGLAQKAEFLAELAARYVAHCESSGLDWQTSAARIPKLLTEANWPLLEGTQVWVDGFSTFTPAEERAAAALLERCAAVTAALALDPQRIEGPLLQDNYDCYSPVRELYQRWLGLTQGAAAVDRSADFVCLNEPRRWAADSPIRLLLDFGAASSAATFPEGDNQTVTAVVCADATAEVEAAAREIRRLVLPARLGGANLRYGQISLALRNLNAYAHLIELALTRLGIPHFIDRRRQVAQHPLCTYLRSALRLALGCAQPADPYRLLKCGLLSLPPEQQSDYQKRADLLESYARAVALPVHDWVSPATWTRWAGEEDQRDERQLFELDSWRREFLAPVVALREVIQARTPAQLAVRSVLERAWVHLITPGVRQLLEDWAGQAAAAGRTDEAELHRKMLELAAGLLDELVSLTGDTLVRPHSEDAAAPGLSARELCDWLASGLDNLALATAPPSLDSVLVTEIGRGRHPEVAATLLLGMAEDGWPLAAPRGIYFSDAERAVLNRQGPLVSDGGSAEPEAEPYLALVALTRPTQYLYLSRPAGDSDGRGRLPSPYYSAVVSRLGLTEQEYSAGDLVTLGPCDNADLVLAAGLMPADSQLQAAASSSSAAEALRGLRWARGARKTALDPALTAAVFRRRSGPPELDVRQLEAFGTCPFRHYGRWLLKLKNPPVHGNPNLSSYYNRLLQTTLQLLSESGYDWNKRPVEPLRAAAVEAQARLGADYGGDGHAHIEARAALLLERLVDQLASQPAGRQPALLNIGFGAGQRFDPLVLQTAAGEVRLRGHIDRLDMDSAGHATIVGMALKPADGALHWSRFAAGAELALPAQLLAVSGQRYARHSAQTSLELRAVAAERQHVEPDWKGDSGLFAPHRLAGADGAAGLLDMLLSTAPAILVFQAGRLLSGEVAPLPLKQGPWTACAGCGLRSVCRFDPAAGAAYHVLSETDAQARKRLASEAKA